MAGSNVLQIEPLTPAIVFVHNNVEQAINRA